MGTVLPVSEATATTRDKHAERAASSAPLLPWSASEVEVLQSLAVDPTTGLDAAAVARRRREAGPNVLRQAERRGAIAILIDQVESFIVVLLLIGAALSFLFSQTVEGVAIVAVIVLNTAIGFVTELRAVRSMEALRELGNVEATVRRNGVLERIPAQDLVPGDIVSVEGGDVITADLRLIESSRLQANESALTGESLPVGKSIAPIKAEVPLAERRNMLYKGTSLTRGAGEGVVVATGMNTELGRITALVEKAEHGDTPMEERLYRLGRSLAWASLAFVTLVAIAGIISGKPFYFVAETAIALAVATVPEGLPIVATLALARGMWRMARRNALIEELAAVETLGSTNIILTDKTGTLTENQMTATRIALEDGTVQITGIGLDLVGEFVRDGRAIAAEKAPPLQDLLRAAALCTDATLRQEETGEVKAVGDPMEVSLLVAAHKAGIAADEIGARFPEVREEAFDPAVKMMATFHRAGSAFLVAVKGAPEAVLTASTRQASRSDTQPLTAERRDAWRQRADELGNAGLRVLAVATKQAARAEEAPYQDLTILGLVGFWDPPRADVRASIQTCHRAGVRVVMVTGDQAGTAVKVGRAVGLVPESQEVRAVLGSEIRPPDRLSPQERQRILEASIVARTSPEQKLDLLSLYQQAGAVVAMIGDGVNDAPALRQANIGVAMGKRGTQVAREAAAMVLEDDQFSTITVAIEQGRVIFANIRKFVVYLVSCNLSEILTVGLASLVNAPLPILPLQILFLNLITDVFPALALGAGEGDRHIMERPPRDPNEPFLTRQHWRRIVGYSLLLAGPVLAGLAIARLGLGMATGRAVTISFLILAFSQLVHVFNMAASEGRLWGNEVTRNPWIWGALALCVVLLLLGVYLPGLSDVLHISDPGRQGWLLIAAMSSIPLLIGQLIRLIGRGRPSSPAPPNDATLGLSARDSQTPRA